jgi:Protein of unknown function (DUF2690)
MRPKLRLAGLLTATALGMALVPMTATSALASECWSQGCYFKDPIQMGCVNSNTQTIYQINGTGRWGDATLELRFSPDCGAAWAKVYNDGLLNNDVVWVENTAGVSITNLVDNGNGSAYTDMVDDEGNWIHARACLGRNNGATYTCTAWW